MALQTSERWEPVEGVFLTRTPSQENKYVVELAAGAADDNDPLLQVCANDQDLELTVDQAEELSLRLRRWSQHMRVSLVLATPGHRSVIFSNGHSAES